MQHPLCLSIHQPLLIQQAAGGAGDVRGGSRFKLNLFGTLSYVYMAVGQSWSLGFATTYETDVRALSLCKHIAGVYEMRTHLIVAHPRITLGTLFSNALRTF